MKRSFSSGFLCLAKALFYGSGLCPLFFMPAENTGIMHPKGNWYCEVLSSFCVRFLAVEGCSRAGKLEKRTYE